MSDHVDPALVRQILGETRGRPLVERLPCGCEVENIDDAFVIRPCSLTCKYFRYAQEESRRQGKPLGIGWEGNQN